MASNATNGDEEQSYPKTHAKELFCLADKDLQDLPAKEKRNPYVHKGTPMKLYKRSDLEEAAIQRWGSLEDMEKEKQTRVAKKEKRELQKAQENDKDEEEENPEAVPSTSQAAKPQAIDENGQLHPLIAERIFKLKTRQGSENGSKPAYVLYWMRTALRDHDNPALDVAIAEAAARKLPLVCISLLMSKAHTYPTHRRFKFLLEGLRDVQCSFADKATASRLIPESRAIQRLTLKLKSKTLESRQATSDLQNIPLLVHVEGLPECSENGKDASWDALKAAAAKADLVVTEIMPTPPYSDNLQFLQDLTKQLPNPVELWTVDTACVVPVTVTNKPYAKAYAYRSATAKLRNDRLQNLPYSGKAVQGLEQDAKDIAGLVPWKSVALAEGQDIGALVDKAGVFDGSVRGVDHMIGGQVAGYARWDAFRKTGLSQYAARRNNPMLRSGVSRLSAYHHFGMVSPFKVARDASSATSSGARKFADEFMTWREVAYCFCYHHVRILETLEVLPQWAQKTLNAHKGDKRELKSLEQLEKGTTGDQIWDALQHQLNITGELHNNVRMTWGKALLPWTPDPETALKQTCHLNHKFALDGCDPSSYGGILWCFGQFDGPKGAESTPIFGSLRNRPTHWLTRKINPDRFRELPLDATTASLVGNAAAAEGTNPKRDIRNLFARAGHQGEDEPSDVLKEGQAQNDSARSPPPQNGSPKEKSTSKKRVGASQPGIQKFFKKAKS